MRRMTDLIDHVVLGCASDLRLCCDPYEAITMQQLNADSEREKRRPSLTNSEIMSISFCRGNLTAGEKPGREYAEPCLQAEPRVLKKRFPHNLGGELSQRRFFYFFDCNPLKSLDSEKEMKANESVFAFIYFHLLAANSPVG
jgi:hypothetical protein